MSLPGYTDLLKYSVEELQSARAFLAQMDLSELSDSDAQEFRKIWNEILDLILRNKK